MDREEGEMSDDYSMQVDDVKEEPISKTEVGRTVLYKAEKHGLIVKQLEKVDASKLEERAKRFGLNLTGSRVVTQTQIDELYRNCGIESGNERHFRFDTLHLSGVDGLTTRDLFEYLEDYKPLSLEWIDDISCNIVCQDHISAALALLVHSREIKNEDIKSMLSEKSPHHWREGMPHPKKDLILMRFATNGDKKMLKKKPDIKESEYYDQSMDSISKNPWGDLCKSWGVYDHQEIFQRKLPKNDYEDVIEEPTKVPIRNNRLAMRLGKRRQSIKEDDSNSDSEWNRKSKAPRMRMHADDEEYKQRKKQVQENNKANEKDIYTPLSIEVDNSKNNYTPKEATILSHKFKYHNKSNEGTQKESIQSRLGAKVVPVEESWSSDEDESPKSPNDHNIMSKVHKVSSGMSSNNASVWSRLESKTSKATNHSDLRQMLKSKKHNKSDDLRDRLGKAKHSNLRIEIDNNLLL